MSMPANDVVSPERLQLLFDDISALKANTVRTKSRDVLLAVALVLLAGGFVYQAWAGWPIHYITEGGPGYSRPGLLPDTMAKEYAIRFVEARYTFIPSTFRAQMEKCLQWLHPALHIRFKADAEQEEREVRKNDMKVSVFVAPSSLVKGRSDTALVLLTGLRAIWVGEAYREEAFKAEITLAPLRPRTPLFPWSNPDTPGQLVVVRSAYTPVLNAVSK